MTSDYKVKSTSTTNGNPTVTDTETQQSWKLTLTVLEVKDGSAVESRADVDPHSFDKTKTGGGDETKAACPFAGAAITLTRHADESLANDFPGKASDDDVSLLNNFITPDEQWYPDKPVAIGDTWDDSAKVSKYVTMGPRDQLTSHSRLDWVKTVDGKQMAQITNSATITYHEDGNVEEDIKFTVTQLVDVASGVTVKCDEQGSSQYTTPKTEPTQVTGGTEFTFHAEVLPVAPAAKP